MTLLEDASLSVLLESGTVGWTELFNSRRLALSRVRSSVAILITSHVRVLTVGSKARRLTCGRHRMLLERVTAVERSSRRSLSPDGRLLLCSGLHRREVLEGAHAVNKLTHVQLSVGVQVKPPDNRLQEPSARNDTALDQVSFEVRLVDVLVVPVVDSLE